VVITDVIVDLSQNTDLASYDPSGSSFCGNPYRWPIRHATAAH
jgi:hypothetical protein